MPDIYATNDGHINKNQGAEYGATWDSVHDATSGQRNSTSTNSTRMAASIQFVYSGNDRWIVQRSFMEFDTSGITILPSDATLKIHSYSSYTADIIVVKGTQSDTLTGTDFDNFDVSVPYSAPVTTWSTSAYQNITLNADALQAMVDNTNFKICIMEHEYDYPDTDPGGNVNRASGCYYSEDTSGTKDPYIDYTAGVITPVVWTEMESKGSDINIKGGSLKIGI